MKKVIRVAILGCGWVTRYFHIPLIGSVPELSLTTLGTARVDQVRVEYPQKRVVGLEEGATTADVDLVVVATANELHSSLTELALRAGKHVVVEKPFTSTVVEARRLTDLSKEVGRSLTVFQNRRWDSDFLTVRQALADRVLGDVVHFESHFEWFAPSVKNAWREAPGPAAGTWYDLGPHLVDQGLLLFGLPRRVSARFAMQRTGVRTDDWCHVVLDYDRLQVILHASQLARNAASRFRIHGTNGTLVKDRGDLQEAQLLQGMDPRCTDFGVDGDDAVLYGALPDAVRRIPAVRGEQRRFYVELARALNGEGGYPVTVEQALAVMTVLEASARSAAEDRIVESEEFLSYSN